MERIHDPKVTGDELAAFVASRGYVAEETRSGVDGQGTMTGYTLKGPRGLRTFIPRSEEGYSLAQARLWADGADYATDRIERRRIERIERAARQNEISDAPASFGR